VAVFTGDDAWELPGPLILKQVGAAMGITKERVRQIQWRAMNKLRVAAEEDRIEAPG
jgi:RNA polymerase primary sigma factor/RNA polymerase sigma factor